ncbi:MAG: hypothetical protein WDW38_002467 [Sanguina aurantia]
MRVEAAAIAIPPALFGGRNGRRDGLRRTFDLIDTNKKGRITESDVEAYANAQGLPAVYAKSFMEAVLLSGSSYGNVLQGSLLTSSEEGFVEEERAVSFDMFNTFVRSREDALKKAFSLFDKDNDGKISVEDLDASLAHVVVLCPKTRCVYKSRRKMAACLMSKAQQGNGTAPASPQQEGAAQTTTAGISGRTIDFKEFRSFFMLLPNDGVMVDYWLSAGRCPDMDTRVAIHEPAASRGSSPWGHLLAGAVAGATSRTVTAPLETLRLAAMAGTLPSPNLVVSATDIVERHGWKALYRGNAVNVMRSAPQKALDFFAFDAIKRLLGEESYLKTFLAAGLAGTLSCITLYPLEVVRSRITVDPVAAAQFRNIGHALLTIARTEGPRALYKGLGPSLAAIFPEAAITYGLHDQLKHIYRRVHHRDPEVLSSLAMGVGSAFCGQLVAFPLETISRRLQVRTAASTGPSTLWAVIQELLKQGGPRALYRGVGAATLRLIPMACVSFGTYEVCRSLLLDFEQWQGEQQAQQEYKQLHSFCTPLTVPTHMEYSGAAVSAIFTPTGAVADAGDCPSTAPGCVIPDPSAGGSYSSSMAGVNGAASASGSGKGVGGPPEPALSAGDHAMAASIARQFAEAAQKRLSTQAAADKLSMPSLQVVVSGAALGSSSNSGSSSGSSNKAEEDKTKP